MMPPAEPARRLCIVLLAQRLELVLVGAHQVVDLLAVLPNLESGHGGDAALAGNLLQYNTLGQYIEAVH